MIDWIQSIKSPGIHFQSNLQVPTTKDAKKRNPNSKATKNISGKSDKKDEKFHLEFWLRFWIVSVFLQLTMSSSGSNVTSSHGQGRGGKQGHQGHLFHRFHPRRLLPEVALVHPAVDAVAIKTADDAIYVTPNGNKTNPFFSPETNSKWIRLQTNPHNLST